MQQAEADHTPAVLQAMAEVDRQCLLKDHPEYLKLVRPESMRQRTATGFCQDLALYSQHPWSFQPKAMPSSTTRNVHIWHGTNDMQARAPPEMPEKAGSLHVTCQHVRTAGTAWHR